MSVFSFILIAIVFTALNFKTKLNRNSPICGCVTAGVSVGTAITVGLIAEKHELCFHIN